MEIQHFSHQHPLALFPSGNGVCRACKESISGTLAYGCTQCQYFLHKSCGELPQVIQYPFHQKHPLTLLAKAPYRWRKFVCSMCKKRHFAFTYHCSECKFDVDIPCSMIRPSTPDENDEQRIQHFSHRHPLVAVTLYGCTTSFRCTACEQIVNEDLAYACWKCKFILHKSCYDLPKKIQHCSHRQHTLTLLARPPYRSKKFSCDVCSRGFTGFTYHCSRCEFDLDILCSSIKPIQHEQGIKHHSHCHSLFKVSLPFNKDDEILRCSLCSEFSDNLMYVCFKCKYFIHVSCAEFPRKIQHSFHPLHNLLTLQGLQNHVSDFKCYVCQEACTGLYFQCSECTFSMDFRCAQTARFMPALHKQKIQHFCHKHPLMPGNLFEEVSSFKCSLCLEFVEGSIYVCLQCKFFVHQSCVDLPQEILHPFHPTHPLRLLPRPDPRPDNKLPDCSACRSACKGFIFRCSECSFQMDFKCAMNSFQMDLNCESPVQHFSHLHPLIPIKGAPFPWKCRACFEDLGVTCYACFQCMYFLGKSCFELPFEILTPIHPQHPLRILTLDPNDDDQQQQCKLCDTNFFFRCFVYHCAECDIMICSICKSRPTIKYERHEHLLVYVKEKYFRNTTNRCNICHAECNKCFLRCVGCNLNLHVKCIPALPVTGKHRSHRHFLTLTDPLPEDDTNEYYCDACEKERNPKLSVYYCAKCEFAAHIECGLSEVGLPNDGESSVACRLMDAGISISDIEEEEEIEGEDSEEALDVGEDEEEEEEEEELDINLSRLSIDGDLEEERTGKTTTKKSWRRWRWERNKLTKRCTLLQKKQQIKSDVSANSSDLEREIDRVREEIKALKRKLKALQRRHGRNRMSDREGAMPVTEQEGIGQG